MKNFVAYNPVKLHFGKNVTDKIGESVKEFGTNVLLIYGKGSVQKYGYYDIIKHQLVNAGLNITEYSGIKPNPVTSDADEAVKLGIEKKCDVIVALGGGSVIDSAKYISVAISENFRVWDIVKGKSVPKKAIPLIAVLTLAATGTEMNPFAVIQNNETKEKLGFGLESMFPKESFLDPQFTYSVPPNQTTYGIVDLIAHAFENFFGDGDSPLTDRFTASIITEAISFAPLLLAEPENYYYRANVMFQATTALNGMTAWGKQGGDWGVHDIGHNLSVLYDTPHGASLSIAYLAWFKYFMNKRPKRFEWLAQLLFNSSDIENMISELENFYKSINAPVRLQNIGINVSEKQTIINLLNKNKVNGTNYKLSSESYESIVELMYE